MNTMTLLGIDIGKHSFHLHGQDTQGHQVLRKKMTRGQLLRSLAQLPTCTPDHSLTLFERGFYSLGLLHQWQQASTERH